MNYLQAKISTFVFSSLWKTITFTWRLRVRSLELQVKSFYGLEWAFNLRVFKNIFSLRIQRLACKIQSLQFGLRIFNFERTLEDNFRAQRRGRQVSEARQGETVSCKKGNGGESIWSEDNHSSCSYRHNRRHFRTSPRKHEQTNSIANQETKRSFAVEERLITDLLAEPSPLFVPGNSSVGRNTCIFVKAFEQEQILFKSYIVIVLFI